MVAMECSINIDDLAYALVEVVGNFWSMVAHCWELEDRGLLEWTEEGVEVLVSHLAESVPALRRFLRRPK